MSKNEIILRNPKQGALVKANKQSQTFLTLLQQSDEQRLIDILKSINFEDTTRLISSLEHIEWTAQFIEKYAEYWNCSSFSQNKALPWSIALIERFETCWNWEVLSSNQALPWSMELIERFENRWECGVLEFSDYGLSNNEALPWSIALIERFEDRWGWGILSSNEALPWSIDLLEKFKHKWDWWWLVYNKKVRQIFTALSVQGIEEVMDYHIENENL
ncbi:MAG TPA: hypothetical protein K8W15_08630 [Gallibacterium anatis]|uniref:Uncharacterized protein n=1 Tax=Gallibacterium anatis TaxID=750 RepID=A0A921HA24_9PAST|nr:hypothetical protein [Gallibacterium anatis]